MNSIFNLIRKNISIADFSLSQIVIAYKYGNLSASKFEFIKIPLLPIIYLFVLFCFRALNA